MGLEGGEHIKVNVYFEKYVDQPINISKRKTVHFLKGDIVIGLIISQVMLPEPWNTIFQLLSELTGIPIFH
ncbi:MAG: hypothetical protein JSV09_07915 [Thermoplasmata archaeon]|nr:MAG: hypothetical protein JSV09_07915 [Thermoplasmata archaeon]